MKQAVALCMVLFALWATSCVDAGYLHGNHHHGSAVATSSIYTARTIQTGPAPTGVYPVNSYQNQGQGGSNSGGHSGSRGGGGGSNGGGQGGAYGNYGNLGSYGGFYPSSTGNGNSNGNYGGHGQGQQG